MRSIRNFNLKVLSWFWLTILVCLLSIAIPAYIMQELSDNSHLTSRENHLLENFAKKMNVLVAETGGNRRAIRSRYRDLDERMPFQWFIINEELEIVASSIPVRDSLKSRFDSRRFWLFARGEHPRDINMEWTRMIGPATLSSRPDWKLILWRPERPRPEDIFQAMPWWLMASIFVLVTSVMSWLLVRSIARPLNRLGTAFSTVGNGGFSHRIEFDNASSKDSEYASSAPFTRLFAQFNEMTAKIAALIQNQKRQSADISHELRTPLTRLQMTLALVRRKCEDPALFPLLERAERENELLNLHIQRLSDLTTMEARAIQQGMVTLSVSSLLDALCEDAAFEAEGLDMQWQHTLCDATLTVYEEPFITAIENVVRNAFKYAASSVSLRCALENNEVIIVIVDDGPGVEESDLVRLTDAFYRTDSARSSETGGLGLGLAITAEAVRLNSGKLLFRRADKGGLQVEMRFQTAVN